MEICRRNLVRLALLCSVGLNILAAASAVPSRHMVPAGMTAAARSEKIGAPVDLYYQNVPPDAPGQSAALQLAIVPRMAGNAMQVQFVPDTGVTIETGASILALQKVQGGNIYRRNLAVRWGAGVPGHIRSIVSIDIGGNRFMSIFTVPVVAAATDPNLPPALKIPRVKPQR